MPNGTAPANIGLAAVDFLEGPGDAEASPEAERAVDRIPAAAEGVSAVAAFAASVWHALARFCVKDNWQFLPFHSEACRRMLQAIAKALVERPKM
jgi:hypothetical protein